MDEIGFHNGQNTVKGYLSEVLDSVHLGVHPRPRQSDLELPQQPVEAAGGDRGGCGGWESGVGSGAWG